MRHLYDMGDKLFGPYGFYDAFAETENWPYNRRRYLTAYGKEQKTEFGTIFIDRDADGYSSASGIVSIENGIATLGEDVYKRQVLGIQALQTGLRL